MGVIDDKIAYRIDFKFIVAEGEKPGGKYTCIRGGCAGWPGGWAIRPSKGNSVRTYVF